MIPEPDRDQAPWGDIMRKEASASLSCPGCVLLGTKDPFEQKMASIIVHNRDLRNHRLAELWHAPSLAWFMLGVRRRTYSPRICIRYAGLSVYSDAWAG